MVILHWNSTPAVIGGLLLLVFNKHMARHIDDYDFRAFHIRWPAHWVERVVILCGVGAIVVGTFDLVRHAHIP